MISFCYLLVFVEKYADHLSNCPSLPGMLMYVDVWCLTISCHMALDNMLPYADQLYVSAALAFLRSWLTIYFDIVSVGASDLIHQ